jgi:PAS domain S-box-containing protein
MPSSLESSRAAVPAAPPSRKAPLVVFALLAAGAVATGAAVYRIGEVDLRARRAGELAGIAAEKADHVGRWRGERLSDAQVLASDPTIVGGLAAARGRRGRAASEDLAPHLYALRAMGDYTAVAVIDLSGEIRASAGTPTVSPGRLRELLVRPTAAGLAVMSDLHRAGDEPSHIGVVAPIRLDRGEFIGAVLLQIDPRPSLFRLVEFWHEPGASAQALLVSAAEGGPRVLNGARGPEGVSTRFPLVGAVARDLELRRPARFQARDARGVAVLGASTPIPDTPWSLLVKEDQADTLAPLRDRALAIGAAVLALVVAAASGVGYWTFLQARRFERAHAVAEAQREALAGRLERLGTYVQDMLFVADDQQRIVEANERSVQLLGYSREELLRMPVRALRDPATLDDYADRVRQQAEHGAALFETRYVRKDGTTFPVQVSVHVETYGGRTYFEAIARDLSDVKRAEQAVRDSEAKFRAAFEHTILGLALVGPDARIFRTNRSMQEMSGYTEAELCGMSVDALYGSAPDEAPTELAHANLLRGEAGHVELPRRLRRKDGTLVETIVRASAVRGDGGAPKLVVALVEDVSEKKRMEAQLLLADRMASVGTLAAGVAHEINNPLAFILSNLEFATSELSRTGADPEVLRALGEAADGGARVREIVRDLKTFSRPGGEVPHAVDVRAVLGSAVGLARNEIRHRARLVVERGHVPPVLADEHRLAQVLVNLLVNAAQAIPAGNVPGNLVRAATSTAPDGRALVEISDTGQGIPPEALPRIFDPFFTTKPVGVGTGLGLSICHGIVAALEGEISVESVVGKGSTFRVHLPAAERGPAAEPRPQPVAEPAPAPAPRMRILVVDDEPLVARAVSRTLAASHDVVALTSARAALERVESGAEAFDAMLCDLMMPEMTGMELYARLLDVSPGLAARTVFLTGGAFTEPARAFLERVPNARLEKPFDPRTLREILSRVLAPERAAG